MEHEAGRGWYDVGGGMAGFWDGTRWTGERIRHEQLRAMTQPPPPMPPPPVARRAGRGIPWYGWLVLIVLFLFIGLPLISAFLQGFSTGLSR